MGAVGLPGHLRGLLLLGGRAGDLLGRRPLLVAGTALFAACSLAGGLATGAGMLVGARLGQGVGAAMMAPAGLSILTTSFNSGDDRNRALGVWGAHAEIRAQRTRIGELLGQLRDIEHERDSDATSRLSAENAALRHRIRDLTTGQRTLEERLQAARSNNRFLDKRIADLEAQVLAPEPGT